MVPNPTVLLRALYPGSGLSLLALATIAVTTVAVTTTTFAGTEVREGGVLHIQNTETPAAGTERIHLQELWSIGGVDDEEVLLGVVRNLIEDDEGNIYILDGQLSEIQVFSPAGEFLRTIGRSGEGPGEFQNATDLYLGPGNLVGVVQVFPGKIVQLALDGTPSGQFPLPEIAGGGFQLAHRVRANDDTVVIAGAWNEGEGKDRVQRTYLKAFDASGQEIAHYHEETRPTQYGGMKFKEREFATFSRRWAMAEDGRLAAAIDFDAYQIHLWRPDGTLDRVVERPGFKIVDRSKKERDRFQTIYNGITSWNPGSTFAVADNHLTVNQIYLRRDGAMWVLASSGMYQNDEGVFATFDVYDRDGHYVRRVEMLGDHDATEDGLFFAGDRLYVVTELLSARMASLGGDSEDEEDGEEAEPISVIAYSMESAD